MERNLLPRAYSYIRMSTEVQAVRGESLRRQLELSRRYALEHGLALQEGDEFRDMGVSAFKGDNLAVGRLGKFVRAAEEGNIEKGSFLLVESLDRISRANVYAAFTLFSRIISANLVLVTLSDGMVYSKESVSSQQGLGQLMISLAIMSRAHEESAMKSRRGSAAWQEKRNLAPSKKVTAMVPSWLKLSPDRTAIEVKKDRAALVLQMFEDSKNGVGAISIVRRLNEGQIPAWGRSKTGWQLSYVKKILDSRAVLGEYQPNTFVDGKRKPLDPIPGYYPRIVTDDLFYAAQVARKSRKNHGGRRGADFANLFTTIARCGTCGATVRYLNKGPKPKGGQYLRCSAAHVAKNCFASHWPYQHFEANFLALVRHLDLGLVVADEATKSRLAGLMQRKAALEGMLESAEDKVKNLVTAMESPLSDSARVQVTERINALAYQIQVWRAEDKELISEIQRHTILISTAAERHRQAIELMGMMDSKKGPDRFALRARLAQLIRDAVDEIRLFPDGKSGATGPQEREADLLSLGFEPARVKAYIERWDGAEPLTKEGKRFYFVKFKNGAHQAVFPDAADERSYRLMAVSGEGLFDVGDAWIDEIKAIPD